jgi:hypothetical protein
MLGERHVTAMRPARVPDFRAGSEFTVKANFWPFFCFQIGYPIMEHGHSAL